MRLRILSGWGHRCGLDERSEDVRGVAVRTAFDQTSEGIDGQITVQTKLVDRACEPRSGQPRGEVEDRAPRRCDWDSVVLGHVVTGQARGAMRCDARARMLG